MSIRIIHGDCRSILPTLAAGSVQCVVTSPPYFGLRDYGTATWDGGDPECDHKKPGTKVSSASTLRSDGRDHTGPYDGEKAITVALPFKDVCDKCGATRIDAQIGLEASPAEYVAEMVAVFREVRRVLRDDGTCWVNLGDSYASAPSGSFDKCQRGGGALEGGGFRANKAMDTTKFGIWKPKDLMMIPARVAIALQADGWYLRSDIIWHKPNPMPESITDRPTTAHEHVFLLAKRAKYFYNAEAVREEVTGNAHPRGNGVTPKSAKPGQGIKSNTSFHAAINELVNSRNLRNVWTIATHPYPEAHFATFPPELAERCIKAGSKPGDTILDPFSGAGTTALVADRLGRHAIGIELNPDYAGMARDRITDDGPLFAEIS